MDKSWCAIEETSNDCSWNSVMLICGVTLPLDLVVKLDRHAHQRKMELVILRERCRGVMQQCPMRTCHAGAVPVVTTLMAELLRPMVDDTTLCRRRCIRA